MFLVQEICMPPDLRQWGAPKHITREAIWQGGEVVVAEEEGFEPPVESPLQRISNPPPSTARPLLREEPL